MSFPHCLRSPVLFLAAMLALAPARATAAEPFLTKTDLFEAGKGG